MEENQIRRIPVVDETGKCCGMVSQADLARHASEEATASLVRDVSRSTEEASRVGCCQCSFSPPNAPRRKVG
ncbi:MAG: CBS domain-containing protein, partial [Brevundimonas sp.]|nr:CBS domain-containing protein [Brevundimonas sp.]